jgi:hypothetical protein
MSMQDDDTTGAIPVEDDSDTSPQVSAPAEDDAAGVDQAQQPQSAAPAPQSGPNPNSVFNVQNVPGNAKRIISYLMGADAAHPQTLDQLGQQVDPQGSMSPGDRNLLALDRVRDTQGDNAAWSIMQANRVAYNAQTAFAKTALQGTQQKPADLRAAIDAANKAQANVLDGSNIQFAPWQGGVTATVTLPGTSQPQQIVLSPQAFSQWLDVGGDGQWDKVMEHSAPAVLQQLAKQYPVAGNTGATRVDQLRPMQPKSQQEPAAPQQVPGTEAMNPDEQPGKVTRQEYQQPQYSGKLTDEQTREKRSYDLFPRAHLDANENAKREQWIAGEEEKEANRENKVDVARETGTNRVEAARVTGTSRENVAKTAGEARVQASQNYSQARVAAARENLQRAQQHEEAVNGRSAAAVTMRGLNAKITTGQKLEPQEQELWNKLLQGTPEPRTQSPAPAAQSAAPRQLSALDQQALQWANANPTDPKAARIKQKLGVQ